VFDWRRARIVAGPAPLTSTPREKQYHIRLRAADPGPTPWSPTCGARN